MIVELQTVEVRLGGHLIVSDADLTGPAGSVLALRGPNGSGKTSLLRVLSGLVKPRLGRRIGPRHCAYVPAAIEPPTIAAGQWLDHFPRAGRGDAHGVLKALAFHGNLSKSCTRLSFGNLRKLLLAEALSSGESLIVVDEAGMGLDGPGIDGLQHTIRELADNGACVIVAEQDSQFMAAADGRYQLGAQRLRKLNRDREDDELHLTGDRRKPDQIRAFARRLGVSGNVAQGESTEVSKDRPLDTSENRSAGTSRERR